MKAFFTYLLFCTPFINGVITDTNNSEEIQTKLEAVRKQGQLTKCKRPETSFLKEQSAFLVETLAFFTFMGGVLIASPIIACSIDDIPGKRITTGMTRFSAWYLSSCAFFGASLALQCTADAIRA